MKNPLRSKATTAIFGAILSTAAGVATNRVEGKWWLEASYFAASVLLLVIAAFAIREKADKGSRSVKRAKKARAALVMRVLPSYYRQFEESLVNSDSVIRFDVPTTYVSMHQGIRLKSSLKLGNPETDGLGIADAYDKSGGYLLLLGQAGSGKTYALSCLLQQLLSRSVDRSREPVPLYIDLSTWGSHSPTFAQWCIDSVSSDYGVDKGLLSLWMEEGDLALIFDGLDELPRKVRRECFTAINRFRQSYGLVPTVVACRDEEYYESSRQLQLTGCLLLRPITEKQVIEALTEVCDEQRDGLAAKAVADYRLRDILRNPLFLNLAINSYAGLPSALIADKRGSWRTSIINAYLDHIQGQVEVSGVQVTGNGWLPKLADKMRLKHETMFYPDRLPVTLVTEYYPRMLELAKKRAAISATITMAVLLVGFRAPFLGVIPKNNLFDVYAGMSLLLTTGFCFGAWKVAQLTVTSPLGRRRITVKRVLPRIAVKWVVAYSCLGSFAALAKGSADRPIIFVIFLIANSGVGLYPGFVLIRNSSASGDERNPAYPGEENRSLAVTAALSSLTTIFALCVSLFMSLGPIGFAQPAMFPLPVGLIVIYFAVPYTVLVGMSNGGIELVVRYSLRKLGTVRGLLPVRYMETFDVLRRSSILTPRQGGYAFIHSLVRDQLSQEAISSMDTL